MKDKVKLIGNMYIVFGLLGLLGLPLIWAQKKALYYVIELLPMMPDETGYVLTVVQDIMALLVPAMIALTVLHIAVNVAVGYCFIKRKLYATCVAASVLTCLFFPFGTVLGVFALVALSEEQTKREFGRAALQRQ